MPSIPARIWVGFAPFVELLFCLFLGKALALLNTTNELVFLAGNHIEIIVCEFALLLFDLSFELLPIAFNLILVHSAPLV